MNNTPENLRRRDALGITAFGRLRRAVVAESTDTQSNEAPVRRGHRRRRLLRNALIGLAAYKLSGFVPELVVGRYSAEVDFLRGQEERLEQNQTDTLTLVLPGAQVRVGKRHAEPIADKLAHLGAVAYVSYSGHDVDIKGIADQVEKYQHKHAHSLKNISLYGVSLGAHVGAAVMAELEARGSKLKLKSVTLDSTPPDFSYTRTPKVGPWIPVLQAMGGDPLITAAGNYKVFGGLRHIFEAGSTPPRLFAAQMGILHDGIHYMEILSRIVKRDEAKVAFLTAADSNNDHTSDPDKSEPRLKALFPNMQTFKVAGDSQGHGNPDQNTAGYKAALHEMLKLWGIVA